MPGGQSNLARVREIAATSITEATAKQRLGRGDKRSMIAAMERSEHKFGDLVDIWYDPPSRDTPGRCGSAQIAIVTDGEADITVTFQGKALDRRYQDVRAHVPYIADLAAAVDHNVYQWSVAKRSRMFSHLLLLLASCMNIPDGASHHVQRPMMAVGFRTLRYR